MLRPPMSHQHRPNPHCARAQRMRCCVCVCQLRACAQHARSFAPDMCTPERAAMRARVLCSHSPACMTPRLSQVQSPKVEHMMEMPSHHH